jgi:cell division protein FtsN
MKPERRQAPRTTLERLAYINLEPDNGGIILNVSEGGLCFRSIAPIEGTGTIHFSLSEHNHSIEADGELAWTDETQKRGGLRFTNVPAEVRKQIGNWISQPAMAPTAEGRLASCLPSPRTSRAFSTRPSNTNAARHIREVKIPTLLTGFSGGLVIGLLVSALAVGAFFIHTHRRQFGESLIQLGERLGARSRPQTVPEPQAISPAPIPVVPRQKQVLGTATKPASSHPVKLEAATPVTVPPMTAVSTQQATDTPVRAAAATGSSPVNSSTPSAPLLPATDVATEFQPIPRVLSTVPEIESANRTSVPVDNRLPSEKYLEVGKFRDKVWAQKTTDKVAQLGFHAIVIRKGHLWTNSYQVLVGPYGNDGDAEAAHKNLASRGFTPRSFERGSRNFSLRPGLTLNGTRMPAGDCIIRWESYMPNAIVKFEDRRSVAVTAEGKWVKRDVRYDNDAFVYVMRGDGSRTLVEIRFAGMNKALVFGKTS